jgi:eukaryotic translation initiation factor 2C
MMVNINVCMTAFIETKNMAQAIMDFQRGSRGAVPRLQEMFGKSGLRVKTRHLGHRKGVWAIGQKTANQERFSCEELGGVVSVAEYFSRSESAATYRGRGVDNSSLEHPNMPLQYPDLPVINLGNAKKAVWVPAELCDIVKGLPFRGRLNDMQTSNMLRAALRTPRENSDLIRGDGFAKLAITPGSPHETLKNFGITIDQQMAVVPARILPPPGLSYGKNARPRVADGSWNLNEVQFHKGGAIGRLTVMIVREQGRPHPWQGPDDQGMWDFVKAFASRCRTAGMSLSADRPNIVPTPPLPPGSPNDPSRSAALNIIRAKMTELANLTPRPTFILVILTNRDNYIYPGLKRIGDVELGIHSVCMQLDKALGRGDPRKQDQYFSNVALKINTKLGGINHKLDAKDLKWLQEKRTMVIGADVTHRTSHSLTL